MHNVETPDDSRTLAESIINAIYEKLPMTLTYEKSDRQVTVRTVEPYEILKTKNGHHLVMALDRDSREPRSWRIDRITSYTLHRKGHRLLEHTNED